MLKRIRDYLKNTREVGQFLRLVDEVDSHFSGETITTRSPRKRDLGDALDELTSIMAERRGISAILEKHGVASIDKTDKLKSLFYRLIACGGGQWVGKTFVATAVLYDVDLLDNLLQIEKSAYGDIDDTTPETDVGVIMATSAIRHVQTEQQLYAPK